MLKNAWFSTYSILFFDNAVNIHWKYITINFSNIH